MDKTPDPMAQIEALKPCPFCGGPAEHVHVYNGEEVIGCADRCAVRPCLARETYAWAADDWNRRALAAQPGQGEAENAWKQLECVGLSVRGRQVTLLFKNDPTAKAAFKRLNGINATPPTPTPDEAGVRAEWQPIETAPKDGTKILLGRVADLDADGEPRPGVVAEGYWLEGYEDAPDAMGHDSCWTDNDFTVFAFPRSFGAEKYRTSGIQPTHWMLLPNPPGYRAALLGEGK